MNILKNYIFALLLILPAVYPCSVPAAGFFTDNKEIIWKSSRSEFLSLNEFFKYADQDTHKFGKNDHPVELDAKEISDILGSLKIRKKDNGAGEKEFEPVFTAQQIKLLSQYLVKGLSRAKPDHDVIFAMEKSIDRGFGLEPNQYFVAGRVFYKDNKLNIIIGDYERPRLRGYELPYDPTRMGIVQYDFDYGRRLRHSSFRKTISSVDGVENKQVNNTRRRDWLVIDVDAASKAYAEMIKTRKKEELAEKRKELREVLSSEEEIDQAEKEQEALRRQVEQLEQEVQSERPPPPETAPAGATKLAPKPAVPAEPAAEETSLEERLKVLKRLLDQGLITEDIYNRKVEALLDESL